MKLPVHTKGGFAVAGGLFAGGLLETLVADAEGTKLSTALETLGRQYSIRLGKPKDALGRAVDPSVDVFAAWLEHGSQLSRELGSEPSTRQLPPKTLLS